MRQDHTNSSSRAVSVAGYGNDGTRTQSKAKSVAGSTVRTNYGNGNGNGNGTGAGGPRKLLSTSVEATGKFQTDNGIAKLKAREREEFLKDKLSAHNGVAFWVRHCVCECICHGVYVLWSVCVMECVSWSVCVCVSWSVFVMECVCHGMCVNMCVDVRTH